MKTTRWRCCWRRPLSGCASTRWMRRAAASRRSSTIRTRSTTMTPFRRSCCARTPPTIIAILRTRASRPSADRSITPRTLTPGILTRYRGMLDAARHGSIQLRSWREFGFLAAVDAWTGVTNVAFREHWGWNPITHAEVRPMLTSLWETPVSDLSMIATIDRKRRRCGVLRARFERDARIAQTRSQAYRPTEAVARAALSSTSASSMRRAGAGSRARWRRGRSSKWRARGCSMRAIRWCSTTTGRRADARKASARASPAISSLIDATSHALRHAAPPDVRRRRSRCAIT